MLGTESFINYAYTTQCNMEGLIQQLKTEEMVDAVCKEHSLNFNLLKELFMLKMKGFNNSEAAQKMGVHRVTIQRYSNTLRKLKESEFQLLYSSVLGEKNEGTNNNNSK